MTGDDLRAVPTWVDWQSNPPKVTIPAATRDALADVLDAAHAVAAEHPCADPGGVCTNKGCIAHRQLVAALAALDADQ